MKLSLCSGLAFMMVLPEVAIGQGSTRSKSRASESVATVEVLAFDTNGKFLGAPVVKLFESDQHRNLASEFHNGIGVGIPFGVYRIEGYLTAYSSDMRYVRVYSPKTTVVLGLTVGHELPVVPMSLRGRVVGAVTPSKLTFTKLMGIYSDLSMEAPVDSDGGFELVGLSWGAYLLLVISEDGVLASRMITVPYTGPPLEIQIGGGRDIHDK